MYEDSKGYSLEVDIWACGVIMYTLYGYISVAPTYSNFAHCILLFRLAGYAPFYHRRQMIMLRMIQEAKYEFRPEQWDAISLEAIELVSDSNWSHTSWLIFHLDQKYARY
jgi:phosphorylase kinase gamma subunit